MTQSIKVKHNIEMAHRLLMTPSKCENIHGHSWWITLELFGTVNKRGLLGGLEFGLVKSTFRAYLDSNFDHRVLLNIDDPWAQPWNPIGTYADEDGSQTLPGLQTSQGDPTTEWLAEHVGLWAYSHYGDSITVEVWETSVNCSTWSYHA